MTMLREFFDITKDSRAIFDGLDIMNTEYSGQINTRPVIFFTFKDCKADSVESLIFWISTVILAEYERYKPLFKTGINESESKVCFIMFNKIYEMLFNHNINMDFLGISIVTLEQAVFEYYKIKPILLIDDYDQPIINSYMNGYLSRMGDFFSGFYGSALKGQDCLHQALLTGIQRVVNDSIFSSLKNIIVYTVINKRYSEYFGLTSDEAKELLSDYGMAFDESVKLKYDGYLFGDSEIYNPWSLLYFAETGELKNYWINTSTNALVRKSIAEADYMFRESFEELIRDGVAEVTANMECSFIELSSRYTLWGLLIISDYIVKDCFPIGTKIYNLLLIYSAIRYIIIDNDYARVRCLIWILIG